MPTKKINKTIVIRGKKKTKLIKRKRDTSRSGYNEDQPFSRPGKKQI